MSEHPLSLQVERTIYSIRREKVMLVTIWRCFMLRELLLSKTGLVRKLEALEQKYDAQFESFSTLSGT